LELVAALVHFEWLRAAISFVGLVITMAAALHWPRINPNWVYPGLLAFLLAIIFSPFVEGQRWPSLPIAFSSGPTANEIADAVIQKLPKTVQNPPSAEEINRAIAPLRAELATITAERNTLKDQLAAAPKPPPYVNPLHNALTKWAFVSTISHQFTHGGLSPECRVTIVQTPVAYAEDMAADFKEIMDAVRWEYEPRIATAPVDKEITVKAVVNDAKSKDCADIIASAIRGHTRDKNGNAYGDDPHRWVRVEDAPDHLKNCPFGCIEVDFGIKNER
jgi:hypothetical protein